MDRILLQYYQVEAFPSPARCIFFFKFVCTFLLGILDQSPGFLLICIHPGDGEVHGPVVLTAETILLRFDDLYTIYSADVLYQQM